MIIKTKTTITINLYGARVHSETVVMQKRQCCGEVRRAARSSFGGPQAAAAVMSARSSCCRSYSTWYQVCQVCKNFYFYTQLVGKLYGGISNMIFSRGPDVTVPVSRHARALCIGTISYYLAIDNIQIL